MEYYDSGLHNFYKTRWTVMK